MKVEDIRDGIEQKALSTDIGKSSSDRRQNRWRMLNRGKLCLLLGGG